MNALRQVAGRTLYRLYYRPVGKFTDMIRAGGPWQMRATEAGRLAMEAAAQTLPAPIITKPNAPSVELHLLTGERFWYQSAFCLYSLAQHSGRELRPVFYDDGSLSAGRRESLRRLFPRAAFVSQLEALAKLDALLPRSRFPHLRERWDHYPNLRKLIDPHLGTQGWKCVIDSDLLFFHCPDFLLQWCSAPALPLHAVDFERSYGYSDGLLQALARGPIADRLNVGLCGLRSEALDWAWLEQVCRTLLEREGTHYFLEQALVALLLSGQACAVAPAADYVTLPSRAEAQACQAVMHHYVANSKRWYFQQNWRKCLPPLATEAVSRIDPRAP